MPQLIQLLENNEVDDTTINLFSAILQTLTNLTTLNSSQKRIIPYINVLSTFLSRCKAVQLKVAIVIKFSSLV